MTTFGVLALALLSSLFSSLLSSLRKAGTCEGFFALLASLLAPLRRRRVSLPVAIMALAWFDQLELLGNVILSLFFFLLLVVASQAVLVPALPLRWQGSSLIVRYCGLCRFLLGACVYALFSAGFSNVNHVNDLFRDPSREMLERRLFDSVSILLSFHPISPL